MFVWDRFFSTFLTMLPQAMLQLSSKPIQSCEVFQQELWSHTALPQVLRHDVVLEPFSSTGRHIIVTNGLHLWPGFFTSSGDSLNAPDTWFWFVSTVSAFILHQWLVHIARNSTVRFADNSKVAYLFNIFDVTPGKWRPTCFCNLTTLSNQPLS